MTTVEPAPIQARSFLLPMRERIDQHSLALRIGTALAVVIAAYHYTFTSLLHELTLDTPLAYLGMVPFIALAMAAVKARPRADEPAIHDRQIDVLIGTPMVAIALFIVTILPARMSSLFWLWRLDVLSLPLFVAGVVTLAFGVRTLWRLKMPIAFLILSWPLIYTSTLYFWLNAITHLTLSWLTRLVGAIPVATRVPGSDGSLFAVSHHGTHFVLSVASACSGVNSGVGFLIVGIAAVSVVRGRWLPKILWLAIGLVWLWALNLLRLLLIFWAGSRYGEHFALDALHPYIGLVLFCVGLAVMVVVMPLFRLEVAFHTADEEPATPAPATPAHRLAVPRARGLFGVLAAVAVWMAVADGGLSQYQLVAGALGSPRLASFAASPAVIPGYTVTFESQFDWAQRFFGSDSIWNRYLYYPSSGSAAPITADVVMTNQLQSFSDYGIEACYHFHGYQVIGDRAFTVGGGVTARVLTYVSPSKTIQWNVVYWIWPVSTDQGRRFERVVLLESGNPAAAAGHPSAAGVDVARQVGNAAYNASIGPFPGRLGAAEASGRTYVVQFASFLVSHRAAAPGGSPS